MLFHHVKNSLTEGPGTFVSQIGALHHLTDKIIPTKKRGEKTPVSFDRKLLFSYFICTSFIFYLIFPFPVIPVIFFSLIWFWFNCN